MNILIVDIKSLKGDVKNYYPYLSSERIERIEHYKEQKDRVRSAIAGLIINACAGETSLCGKVTADELTSYPLAKISYGEHGKPYCTEKKICFNISHSGDYVVGVYSDKEIGIDIQEKKRVKETLKKRLLNEKENIQDDDIVKYWAIKESFVKMTGMGLSYDFRNCMIDFEKKCIADVYNKDIRGVFSQINFDEKYELFVCETY